MILGMEHVKMDVPHEDGEWMLVRTELPESVAIKARTAAEQNGMQLAAPIIADVGPDTFNRIMGMLNDGMSPEQIAATVNEEAEPEQVKTKGKAKGKSQPKPAPAAEPESESVRNGIDMDVAATEMIVDWSYTTINKRGRPVPVPVKLEHVRFLDKKTRRWVHDLAWEALKADTDEDVEKNS